MTGPRDFRKLLAAAEGVDSCAVQFMERHRTCGSLLNTVVRRSTPRELCEALIFYYGFHRSWPMIADIIQEFGGGPEGLELYRVELASPGSGGEVKVPMGRFPAHMFTDEEDPKALLSRDVAIIRPQWYWRADMYQGAVELKWGWNTRAGQVVVWSGALHTTAG
jgi:hypothetical protein